MTAASSSSPSSSLTDANKATGSINDIIYSLINIDLSSDDDIKNVFNEDKIIEICNNKDHKALFSNTYHIKTLYQGGQQDNNGDIIYPLHMCCALGCSLSTIKLIYKQYPAALEASSINKGMKCLHYCVLYHRSPLDVIQYIIKKDTSQQQLLSTTNNSLLTPLHIACMCPTSLIHYNPEIIMILTEIGTAGACGALDQYGRTPLHIACSQYKPNIKVIEDLTEVYPEACTIQCILYKSTPLHTLCTNDHISSIDLLESFVDVFKDVLRTEPDVCIIKDIDNEIPFDILLHNHGNYKILKLLYKKSTPIISLDRLIKNRNDNTKSNNMISYRDYIKQNYSTQQQQNDIYELFET